MNHRSLAFFGASFVASFAISASSTSNATTHAYAPQACMPYTPSAAAKIFSGTNIGLWNGDTAQNWDVHCPYISTSPTPTDIYVAVVDNNSTDNFRAQVCTWSNSGLTVGCGGFADSTGTGAQLLFPPLPSFVWYLQVWVRIPKANPAASYLKGVTWTD